MTPTVPRLSVIIPTRNRAAHLAKLLHSLDQVTEPAIAWEIVVADNGSSDGTSRLLADWRRSGGGRAVVRVDQPGKSRAVNAAIATSSGEVLCFLDDDITVEPAWLCAVWEHFERRPNAVAAQGAILWPAEVEEDPELRASIEGHGTIVRHVLPQGTLASQLIGFNMALRRHTMGVLGGFDERLGPGASGLSDERELADRLRKLGGAVDYMADARVIHEIDDAHLTEEFFREHHRKQGRSRFAYKQNGLFSSILPNLAKAALTYILWTITGNIRRRYRARGRLYHYREMLRLRGRRDMNAGTKAARKP
ncbi:MAG: glycosyltransferase family 2 protein [Deltaproteobacteria bacterium]